MSYKISPAKATHAVDMCALIVDLEKPLPAKIGARIYEEERLAIGGLLKQVVPAKRGEPLSIHFKAAEAAEETWSIRVSKNSVGVYCFDYQRWEPFLRQALLFFSSIGELIGTSDVAALKLGVLDIFQVEVKGEFALENLFRKNSQYVPQAFFASGAAPASASCSVSDHLTDSEWGARHSKLLVSAAGEAGGLSFEVDNLNILLAGRRALRVEQLLADGCASLQESACLLHAENKTIISEVLNDSVLERIGLKGNSDAGNM